MSTISLKGGSAVTHVIGDALYGAVSTVSAVFNIINVVADKYQTRRALGKLSARELEDIGISRADIPSVVDDIFRGKN